MKIKIELIEETPEKVIFKFPSMEIPVEVSHRYFEKIKESEAYDILNLEKEEELV